MSDKKKLKLNMKFIKDKVVCAKNQEFCEECNEDCEKMELFYYPFNKEDIRQCFKNEEKME